MQSENLIDSQYTFTDLVDIKKLKLIFDKFSKITDFAISLIDNNTLEVLIKTGWHDICENFHRADDRACKVCKQSNKILFADLDKEKTVKIVECEHGLYDCATPIIIEGQHIANIVTGQLLMQKPDTKKFEKNAAKYGFDKEKYLEALDEVPIVDKEKVTKETSFVNDLGADSLDTVELVMELEEEFDINIPDDAAEKITTVGEAIVHIESAVDSGDGQGSDEVS